MNINTIKNTLYLIIVLTLLLSCAIAPRKYIPPDMGAVAYLSVNSIDNRKFNVFTYDEALSCTRRKMIKRIDEHNIKNVVIKADEKISLTLSWDVSVVLSPLTYNVQGCNPTITFIPESNKHYIVSPQSHVIGECAINLTSNSEKIHVTNKSYITGFNENSSFCK